MVKKATKKAVATKKATKKVASVVPGEKVGGRYRPGSGNAALFQLLSDGRSHTAEECKEAVVKATGSNWPLDPIWYVAKHGEQTGDWELERSESSYSKGSFRLILRGKKAPAVKKAPVKKPTKKAAAKKTTKKAPAKKTTKKAAVKKAAKKRTGRKQQSTGDEVIVG